MCLSICPIDGLSGRTGNSRSRENILESYLFTHIDTILMDSLSVLTASFCLRFGFDNGPVIVIHGPISLIKGKPAFYFYLCFNHLNIHQDYQSIC